LRCPRLITLRHVVLHRVIVEFWPDVAYACTLLSDFTLGSESNEVKAFLPAGARKKITDWTELGWSERQVGVQKALGCYFPCPARTESN
jgi:hypothetical protein